MFQGPKGCIAQMCKVWKQKHFFQLYSTLSLSILFDASTEKGVDLWNPILIVETPNLAKTF